MFFFQTGCSPTFGPAYINFYGAQRRFRLLENDEIQELNSGKVLKVLLINIFVLESLTSYHPAHPNNEYVVVTTG